jgi:hypothetical protein
MPYSVCTHNCSRPTCIFMCFLLDFAQFIIIITIIDGYLAHTSRSQWPCGLGRRSSAARLLRSWVRICGGTARLDLDTGKTGNDTSYGSQTYTTRLADTTCFPVLAPAKAGGDTMDHCSPRLLPPTIQ